MKKIIALTLGVYSAFITTQAGQARNPAKDSITTQQHHSGNGSALSLGGYTALCQGENAGIAVADSRNITVNGHSQQVVHLKAEGATAAFSFLNNLDTVTTIVNAPINFTVRKGNAKFLEVIANWIPHGSTETGSAAFVTPDTKLNLENALTLISNGNGKYSIPLGSGGIPQGAQLQVFFFLQNANENNCSNHASNINELQINRNFVGIETDGAQTCGTNCGEGDVGAAEE